MIPLKLQVRNFLSYGPTTQTIDFSPHRLICLSGKNGHGKSALLDAITWAVWGQARKIAGATKPDQGLMRIGQTHMMVCLDFSFNNQVYRVRRELSMQNTTKSYLTLDFAMLDEQQQVRALTGKTTRATQEQIEQILNLDFTSFANSAFLRQGHADEFSKKSPKERKDILAAILGLNRYETTRKLALERVRTATNQRATAQALHEKYSHEIEKNQSLHEEQHIIEQKLTAHKKQEQTLQTALKKIDDEKDTLRIHQREQEKLLYHAEQLAKQKEKDEHQLRTIRKTWRTLHKKVCTLPDKTTLEHQKNKTEQQYQKEQRALQEQLELKQRHLQKKEALHTLEQQLKQEQSTRLSDKKIALEQLRFEHAQQTQECQRLEQERTLKEKEIERLNTTIDSSAKLVQRYKKTEQQRSQLEALFEKRKEHYQRYITQGNLLTTDLKNLAQKKELSCEESNPSCPLCEQNLSAARKRFLKQKFEHDEHNLRHKIARITKLVSRLKTQLLDQHEKIKKAHSDAQELAAYQAQHKEQCQYKDKHVQQHQHTLQLHTQHQKQCSALELRIATHEKELHALEQHNKKEITNNDAYKKIKKELDSLAQRISTIDYNEQRYKDTQKQLSLLTQQCADYDRVAKELATQPERAQTIAALCQALRQNKLEKKELEKKLTALKWLDTHEQKLTQQESDHKKALTELAIQKEQIIQKKGTLEAQQAAIKKYKEQQTEQKKLLETLGETIDDYQVIAQALSKDGIQALLIEEAIPEIEQEANDLLARLTNNQAQIIIESLRDLKKGGTKETLDIKISDQVGIRSYELFSGGEAFRIDFALRIAISKLLARRAGTSLQTLIIDEGFGSQDEEGLSRIMNALYAIQDDFSKIIIVSHLSSMKDQFPVHLTINKGPNGSTVSILQQG